MNKPTQDETKLRPKNFWRNLRRTLKYAKSSRKYVVLYVVLGLVEIPLSVVVPMLSAQRILELTGNKLDQLLYTSLAVFGIGLVLNVLDFVDHILYWKIYRQIMTKLRTAIIREAIKLEVREVDKSSTGVFITRINVDTNDVSFVLGEIVYQVTAILTRVGVKIGRAHV